MLYLLPGAVPPRVADGVGGDVGPVDVVGAAVPVDGHGALQADDGDHDVCLLGRVERHPPDVGAAREEQEATQV